MNYKISVLILFLSFASLIIPSFKDTNNPLKSIGNAVQNVSNGRSSISDKLVTGAVVSAGINTFSHPGSGLITLITLGLAVYIDQDNDTSYCTNIISTAIVANRIYKILDRTISAFDTNKNDL